MIYYSPLEKEEDVIKKGTQKFSRFLSRGGLEFPEKEGIEN